MEAALEILLPKIARDLTFRIYPHNGKEALLGKLPGRLRGYRAMIQPDWLILVVVDRDRDECRSLKQKLERMADDAGLMTKTHARAGQFDVLNRIAIEELEAWYFGDWPAVRAAYPNVPKWIPRRAPYRDPDAITGGTGEALQRILQNAGHISGRLPKIEAARTIAPHMDPARNTSRSFQVFRDALLEAASA